jgi:hypothetical protein
VKAKFISENISFEHINNSLNLGIKMDITDVYFDRPVYGFSKTEQVHLSKGKDDEDIEVYLELWDPKENDIDVICGFDNNGNSIQSFAENVKGKVLFNGKIYDLF